ncbi:conjugal transfer protein TrbL family protein [Paenibacillus crassostreae]|uniref:Conjugal transfer protein TraL n=1 Tax=Paenibacillus crassostreae TaxID=1763538 RepID=A0A167EKF6_9BACL|nr:conjugal transfer protein TrbL family protein [Paenibacillus crassostreae]AOZ94875.1 conjugal transfer protein TraL [Paenibacillus crassostreae]OAB75630.1 conjugal transfer protein TraL [Paenibacillus crassostreae]
MKFSKWLSSILLVLIVATCAFPSISFAEEGDYYEEYEAFFENAPESYKDFIKKYDPYERTVSCGRFEVSCHVYKIALDSGVSAMDFIKDLMKKTVISPTDIVGNTSYQAYKDGIFALSKIVLAIFIAFNAAKIMSLRMGDADDGATVWNEKIVSLVVSAFFLFVYDSIIEWILHAQELMMHEIIDTINSEEMIINIINNILMGPGLFAIIVILIIGIMLIVLMLQLFYRTAFVAILYIVGPIAIATKINDTYNFFDFWLKNFVIAFVTLALQLISIAVGLNQFLIPPSYFGDTYHLFLGAAFFILSMTLPGILGQWGFSTGSARSVASGAKSAVKLMVMKRR